MHKRESLLCGFALSIGALIVQVQATAPGFSTELFEDLPGDWHSSWSFEGLTPALKWNKPWLAVGTVPDKLSPAGVSMFREKPFAVRVTGELPLAAGDYEFHLRSRMKARFYIDDRLVLTADVPPKVVLTPEQIAAKEAEDKKAREGIVTLRVRAECDAE